MKKIHLFGLVVIAVAVMIIMSTAGDASTYVDFGTAEKMALTGDGDKVHVVGALKKDAAGQIVGMMHNPAIDANRFEFTLVDDKGKEVQVVSNNPKPQDIDKSEKVVIIGQMQGDIFKCDKILLKCPSKYQEKGLDVKDGAKTAVL
ncbi:MAG: cytochrome c maturation protein CcmE [Cytophagaceae bacterium]|nr:cytochrome c maturation protein CcmE [Cytophagaceae bacterium]